MENLDDRDGKVNESDFKNLGIPGTTIMDLIPKLESLRTLVVYDNLPTLRGLLFYYVFPYFSTFKDIFVAIYSDIMYRKFEKMYRFISKFSSKVMKTFNNKINIIKISSSDEVSFGLLYEYIDLDNSTWYKRFGDVIRKLDENDLVVLMGFSMIPAVYGQKSVVKVYEIFDRIPRNITLINECSAKFYSGSVEKFLEQLHDVVLRIEKDREFYGFSTGYRISLDKNETAEVGFDTVRFKISENGRFIEF